MLFMDRHMEGPTLFVEILRHGLCLQWIGHMGLWYGLVHARLQALHVLWLMGYCLYDPSGCTFEMDEVMVRYPFIPQFILFSFLLV